MRIEDTDELRSSGESAGSIFSSLEWLGLDWDEGAAPGGSGKGEFGPYVQSEREAAGIYGEYAGRLLKEGKAYYCYCAPEELDERRKKAQAEKKSFLGYDARCRRLTSAQIEEYRKRGRKPVVRFKMPEEGETVFEDLTHKTLSFKNELLYDCVIMKASGYPTYNFACTVDDGLMRITHVIRGDDHISNTPLQINIYRALGFEVPRFAHLSMILGPDGKRLSKRHGATSVEEYRKNGFLPAALKNYLALLGWSTPDSRQIFEKGELEEKFSLEGCQKSPAVFDDEKLKWMNGEYIRRLSKKELLELALPFLRESGLGVKGNERDAEIVGLGREKYKLLSEIPGMVEFFYGSPRLEPEALEKTLKKPEVKRILEGIKKAYSSLGDFTERQIEGETRKFAADNGFKSGQVFHPVRAAVSGRTRGPTLFKMIELIGKEEVLRRIDETLEVV